MTFSEQRQKLLSEISVQCSVAQDHIAKYFDKPNGDELLAILLALRGLLDSFIDEQAKT